jgi:acyl-CoA thioesterase
MRSGFWLTCALSARKRPVREEDIRRYIERDPFARQLGVTIDALEAGYCRASLTITDGMTNFHGMTHGGVVFTLADVALAAASNSRGQFSVALQLDITFLTATRAGERLVAEAREQEANGPIVSYVVTVRQDGASDAIARAQAVAYRKKEWFVAP